MNETLNSNKLWNTSEEHHIVLNKHFCFIQIPKTSSSNMMQNCIEKGLITMLPCYRHEGLLFIEKYIDDSNFPIYTIVRNPFCQIHSYFFHRIKHNEIKIDKNLSIVANFENFCRNTFNDVHLQQYNYIRSNKNLKVKFFKLEEGVDKLNNHILKTHNIDLQLQKTHHNANEIKDKTKVDLQSFFANKEIIDLIIQARRKEFELFNYPTNINSI